MKTILSLDSKGERTQRVGSSFYCEYQSKDQQFIIEQSSKFLYTNPLHFDQTLGSQQLENELVSWMANLFSGDDKVLGSTTTGGTESIFMAMFSLREYLKNEGY